MIVSLGGVDFSSSPRNNITPVEFRKVAPKLPVTIASSQFADRQDEDGLRTWFGGAAGQPRQQPAPPPGGGTGGGLPITGASVGRTILAAVLLLIAGVVLVLWARRRRIHWSRQ